MTCQASVERVDSDPDHREVYERLPRLDDDVNARLAGPRAHHRNRPLTDDSAAWDRIHHRPLRRCCDDAGADALVHVCEKVCSLVEVVAADDLSSGGQIRCCGMLASPEDDGGRSVDDGEHCRVGAVETGRAETDDRDGTTHGPGGRTADGVHTP